MAASSAPSPLGHPPPGGDRSRGAAFTITAIIFNAIAALFVLSRLFVRCFITRNLGLEYVLFGVILAYFVPDLES